MMASVLMERPVNLFESGNLLHDTAVGELQNFRASKLPNFHCAGAQLSTLNMGSRQGSAAAKARSMQIIMAKASKGARLEHF